MERLVVRIEDTIQERESSKDVISFRFWLACNLIDLVDAQWHLAYVHQIGTSNLWWTTRSEIIQKETQFALHAIRGVVLHFFERSERFRRSTGFWHNSRLNLNALLFWSVSFHDLDYNKMCVIQLTSTPCTEYSLGQVQGPGWIEAIISRLFIHQIEFGLN